MKVKFNEKQTTSAVYCIIVFTVCLLLTALVFKYDAALKYVNVFLETLAPVIWGVVIAYLLNPVVKFIERQLNRFIFKKKKRPKITRTVSITLTFVFLLGIIAAIIGSIVPEILGTLKSLLSNIGSYISNFQRYFNNKINDTLEVNPELADFINSKFDSVQDLTTKLVSEYLPKLDNILAEDGVVADVTSGAWSFVTGLKNCVIGIFFSIYLLFSKDMFLAQTKKVAYALIPERARVHVFSITSRANSTFINFLIGKIIDSFIIGVLCFIGMMILGMRDYAVLISVIVGVTNVIPFFGPFIGAIPSAILILLTTPEKTILFVLFVFLLQQFDGNVLGPKILGNTLGLPTFWTMFAIIVGGGLFGIVGMVAFIPLFAVLYSIFREIVSCKLQAKKLPYDTEYYMDLDMNGSEDGHIVEEEKQSEKEKTKKEKTKEKITNKDKNVTEEKTEEV